MAITKALTNHIDTATSPLPLPRSTSSLPPPRPCLIYIQNEGWATEAQLTKMVAATAADYTSYVNVVSFLSLKGIPQYILLSVSFLAFFLSFLPPHATRTSLLRSFALLFFISLSLFFFFLFPFLQPHLSPLSPLLQSHRQPHLSLSFSFPQNPYPGFKRKLEGRHGRTWRGRKHLASKRWVPSLT